MTGLPRVNVNITGGIVRPNLSKDGIAGFPFYNDNIADLTQFSATNRIIKFTNLASIESVGITSNSTNFKVEHYILKEFFRAGGGEVYIGIFDVPAVSYDFSELTTMHLFSNGEIKLYGIFANIAFVETDLALINAELATFEVTKQPAHAFYAADISAITIGGLPNLRTLAADLPYVSFVAGQDTENEPLALGTTFSLPNLGVVVGTEATSKVNENILNVGKYNYTDGINMLVPGFFVNDGTSDNTMIAVTDIAVADLNLLNDKGYIFWRYFPNLAGTYLSNDHNCVDVTETFNSIHIMRTRNKAVRLLDGNLTPLIGSTVLFNADGTLRTSSIKVFEDASKEILNQMTSDTEISTYDVYIDPTQKVAITKTVIVQVSILPTESADYITLNLAFVASL